MDFHTSSLRLPPSSPSALLTFPLTSLWLLVLTFSLFLLYILLSSPLNRAQSKYSLTKDYYPQICGGAERLL